MYEKKLLHIDLFSGIGGFALAADRIFGNVEHIFCEIDPFCQEVLKKHWPEAKIYGDIRTLTYAAESGREHSSIEGVSEQSKRSREYPGEVQRPVFILTGGFPCQPFSQAGRRRGEEDDRFLWPEMLRVIREFSPLWVIAENVRGLLTQGGGVVFERVCTDLEAAGYEVQPLIIPAVAVGAPHRRDRVWFVGHSKSGGGGEVSEICKGQSSHSTGGDRTNQQTNAPDTRQQYGGTGRDEGVATSTTIGASRESDTKRRGEDDTNSNSSRLQRGAETRDTGESRETTEQRFGEHREKWRENWLEVATRLCRVDDGVPKRMDRNPRLKALGNAIVPQVAEEIMRVILQI